ncbi:uncharacterized protein J4E92_006384 [Alternaria infectoria]|uniref:uncharacterized protein n=1 Tax=Alternaria infectoria TaxID=45303 RepID=UPI00221E544C|nr:uncharacterized protein J4E92_006384 [Alternaria infectoria]KAI4927217.1 hypothetical protein J4E92_006384 [Alternaria infectoria]
MRPQDTKNEDIPPRASRVPSSSRHEPEDMLEESREATSGYGGDEESESDMTTAPEPVLRYRRRVDDPQTPLRAPRVQTPSRPQDPQTPPRGTSRGLEGDLARAGEVLRDQTRNEYHRRRSDAQDDHAAHRNAETSSAVARAQAGVGNRFGAGGQIPPRGVFTPVLRRNAVQQLGIPPSNPFGYGVGSFPQLPPETMQTIGDNSDSGEFGSSMAAMTPFHRQANQAAFERQAARQEASPEPDLPHPRRRPTGPHPAHFQTPTRPSPHQQPGQQSTRSPAQPSSKSQGPEGSARAPSRRRLEDIEDQDAENMK